MASSRRDHLVDVALELFCRDGFHATGIDKILATAGVAKMTLYNHFKSKDELILAVLHRRDENFRNWFMRTVERRARRPRERLLAAFDALGEWTRDKSFQGCMFINASAEFAAPDNPIHAAAATHKRLVRAYLLAQARAAGADDPERLAGQLTLLLEGAIVMTQVAGERDAPQEAKRAAEVLIKEAGL